MAKITLQSLLLAGLAVAVPTERITARAPATAQPDNVLSLRRVERTPPGLSSVAGHTKRKHVRRFAMAVDAADPIAIGTSPAIANSNQIEYTTEVKAGSRSYTMIVDTGSSDTWFASEAFQCLDYYNRLMPIEYCEFGMPLWKGGFPGGNIPHFNFSVSYGTWDGPWLEGLMGYSDLEVAGVTIPKQQIALAQIGYWTGDKLSSGILGLGLPALTETYVRNNSGPDTILSYSPVATTVRDQLQNPYFALALSRDPTRSFLSFGGVPPAVNVTSDWATAKIEKMVRRNGVGEDYFYYFVKPDAMEWSVKGGKTAAENGSATAIPRMVVDSGTTINLFPFEIAERINAQFDPPAVSYPDQGLWAVNCTAKPPSFGITFGGKTLWTDPSSMILPNVRDSATGLCLTGIGYSDYEPFILGDTFMQQLVTVFDVGEKMEIKFAQYK